MHSRVHLHFGTRRAFVNHIAELVSYMETGIVIVFDVKIYAESVQSA